MDTKVGLMYNESEETFWEKIEDKFPNFYFSIKRFITNIPYKVKMKYQKITRGYSDNEVWGLSYSIADFILPRLKALRKLDKSGFPGTLDQEIKDTRLKGIKHDSDEYYKTCSDYWDEILDKIIWSFQYIKDDGFGYYKYHDENGKLYSQEELPELVMVNKKKDERGYVSCTLEYSDGNNYTLDKEYLDKLQKKYFDGMNLFVKHFSSLGD